MSLDDEIRLLRQKHGSLNTERSSWDSHWLELGRYFAPRATRFDLTDHNKGDKRHGHLLINTTLRAVRIAVAGLMSGMTSPARPWFKIETPDAELNEYGPVKLWLSQTTKIMRNIFHRSNTYRSLGQMYRDLLVFGTSCDLVLPDFKDVIRHYSIPMGEYTLALDGRLEPGAMYREYEITVHQAVEEFGIQNVSRKVKNLHDTGHLYNQWIPVIHVIEPRKNYDPRSPLSRDMPFKSCYFEAGSPEKYLRESGFKRFRLLAPRWEVEGRDVYGSSPGMEALGDAKQLQHQQTRKAQSIDFQTKPPLQAPSSLKGKESALVPGGILWYDGAPGNKIEPAFTSNLNLNHLLQDMAATEERINSSFFADLFLMIASLDKSGVTAREVGERHEEKLLMLGPVLERLHNELHGKFIDLTYMDMLDSNLVPPKPREMEQLPLEVVFISVLAQAQRAIGISSVERLLTMASGMSAMNPEVIDKIDMDQVIDDSADMLGVSPQIIRSDERVQEIRDIRAEAAAKAQAQAAAPVQAQTMQTLAETPTDGNTALADALGQLTGYQGL